MVLLMTEEAEEKRIVTEFCHLLEKSKQLFNGLRDLPPYGYKQWQTYFGRTFDIYTKLWKFQQQYRPTLDKIYCLKRWQIGEIASKIGQLYYHYYLRTSEITYLHEAASFYGAIRSRGYYNKKEERHEFLIKKLRYLARFILVCLLLRRMKLLKELVHELSEHIENYASTPMYEPEDHLEWTFVLGEILSFLQAESPLTIIIRRPAHHHHHSHLTELELDGDGDGDGDDDDDGGGGMDDDDDLVDYDSDDLKERMNHDIELLYFIPTYRLTLGTTPPAFSGALAGATGQHRESISSSNSGGSSSAAAAAAVPGPTTTTGPGPSTGTGAGGTGGGGGGGLNLQEALIICTKSDQVKFSDYTIDMYRMLQSLEREGNSNQSLGGGHASSSGAAIGGAPAPPPPPPPCNSNSTTNNLSGGGGATSITITADFEQCESKIDDGSTEEDQLMNHEHDGGGGDDDEEEDAEDCSPSKQQRHTTTTPGENSQSEQQQKQQSTSSASGRHHHHHHHQPPHGGTGGGGGEKVNPHKYLLYKPTIEQLLVYISSSWKCLGHEGVLLIYISGDMMAPQPSSSGAGAGLTTPGGGGGDSLNGEMVIGSSTNPFRPRPIAIPIQPACTSTISAGYDSGGISTIPLLLKKESSHNTISVHEDTTSAAGGVGGQAQPHSHRNSVSSTSKMVAMSMNSSKCQRKDKQCLYPGDLLPYTRKPLFLIVDSENSHIYAEIYNSSPFATPMLILMSPMELPPALHPGIQPSSGSLFTYFLHSPFSAFACITSISTISKTKWNTGQDIIHKFLVEANRIYLEGGAAAGADSIAMTPGNHKDPHHNNNSGAETVGRTHHQQQFMIIEFFTDDFLRVLILRFVFCDMVLRMHKGFQYSTRCFPRSSPNITTQIKHSPTAFKSLQSIVVELIQLLAVGEYFNVEPPNSID